jgi:hypothetical protein
MTIRDCLAVVCRWAGALLPAVLPAVTFAQFTATPYAGESYDYNSDIFYLPTGGPAPIGKDGPTFADSTLRTRVGVDGNYLWDAQKFTFTVEGRRYDYEHFTDLDHNEGTLDGGMKWVVGSLWDGTVDYHHERSMVQFTDLIDVTQLILQTENRALVTANLHVTPDWRVDTQLFNRELYSPRPDAPSLSLHEESITEGVSYLGLGDVTAGFDVQYLKGTYSNAPLTEAVALRYHQVTVEANGTYVVSGLTTVTGNLGYTRRTDEVESEVFGLGGNDGVSGVTGKVVYKRDLTVKTSVGAQFDRGINSYVTTAGSEVDLSAQVFATWLATYRLSVRASYKWTDSKFPQYGFGDRTDHLQYANLEATYELFHWLTIRPYARYQTRSSTLADYSFNSTGLGIEFLATLFKHQ